MTTNALKRAVSALAAAAALASCESSPAQVPLPDLQPFFAPATGATAAELALARDATAKYHDLDAALADGYEDIHVVIQNMGRHFMKKSLVDDRFELDKPEILVYAPVNGKWELAAVEYAVPLELSASAPAGFTGDSDVWDHNTGFGLWLLHAWVWRQNPDGVFAPMNPRVILPGTSADSAGRRAAARPGIT